MDSGDQELKEHLETAPKNASYISKTTQNGIIDSCGNVIQEHLLQSIRKATYFSILVDETTDVSILEQMSLCIRYLDIVSIQIKEVFLGFIEVTDLTGENLAAVITEELKKMDLNIENLRGQGKCIV